MKTSAHRGRPAIYTRERITALLNIVKRTGKSLKSVVLAIGNAERAKVSSRRRKEFKPSVKYVPLLVAMAKLKMNLRRGK